LSIRGIHHNQHHIKNQTTNQQKWLLNKAKPKQGASQAPRRCRAGKEEQA
jgi:hypothetical protein